MVAGSLPTTAPAAGENQGDAGRQKTHKPTTPETPFLVTTRAGCAGGVHDEKIPPDRGKQRTVASLRRLLWVPPDRMPTPRRRISRQARLRRTILVTTTILLATASGVVYYSIKGSRPVTGGPADMQPARTRPVPRTSTPPSLSRLGIRVSAPRWTALATLNGPVDAYSSPAAVGPSQLLAPTWGAPMTLPVMARRAHWLKVRVVALPRGQTAWIPSAQVTLTWTQYYLIVDLNEKHLLLFRDGNLALYVPVGVGAPQTPTPVGRYFVRFFTRSPNPAYGPFVIVTSCLASTDTAWEEEGTPVITLNGPFESSALTASHGAAVSQGSVLLSDSDLQRLRPVPAGTPIDILAQLSPGPSRRPPTTQR